MVNLGYLCSIINLKSLNAHIINKNKQINKFAFVCIYSFTNCLFSKKKTLILAFLIFLYYLFAFYLFVFFLFIIQLTKAKKASNTSLLYSFSIISVFFLFII